MRRGLLLTVFTIAAIFTTPNIVEARSGCCSHHGGVCGCGCCDGSALSTTCAPYYPECSRTVNVVPIMTIKPIINTPRPTPRIIATPSPLYTPISTPTILQKLPTSTPIAKGYSQSRSGDTFLLLALGALVYFGLGALAKKTNKSNEKHD